MYRYCKHHYGGSFYFVHDILILLKDVGHTHKYKFGFKKKSSKESQYMFSHPETDSDPPIGSDRESGLDSPPARGKILKVGASTSPSSTVGAGYSSGRVDEPPWMFSLFRSGVPRHGALRPLL